MRRAGGPSSFVRHAVIYGAGQAFQYAAPLLLVSLYARALTPDDLGTITVLKGLGDVLNLCLLFGGLRQAAIARHGQASPEDRSAVTATTTLLTVGLLCLGALLVGVVAQPLAGWFQVAIRLLLLAALAALLEGASYVLLALPQARGEARLVVLVNAAQLLLRVALCFLFVAWWGGGVEGVFLAGVIASGSVVLYLLGREARLAALVPDLAIVGDLVRFALPFLPGGLCLFLLNTGDRFLVLEWVGKAAVGTYDLGYRLASACYSLSVGPLNMVWGTRMYQAAKQADAPTIFGQAATLILMAYTATALAGCLFADEGVRILGAGRYPDAAAIIPPVALAMWFLTAATLCDAPFYVRRRTGLKTVVSVASGVVVAGFYVLWIPPYGGLGAAWATVAGFAFQAALTRIVGQKLFRVDYEDVRLVATLGTAVLLWAGSRWLPAGPCDHGTRVFLWLMFPAMLWMMGVLRAEERAWARGQLGRVIQRAGWWLPVRA